MGPTLAHLPAARVAFLTGRAFFPHLIATPFESGVGEAFTFAVLACVIAAAASWLWGAKYHHRIADVDTTRSDEEATSIMQGSLPTGVTMAASHDDETIDLLDMTMCLVSHEPDRR